MMRSKHFIFAASLLLAAGTYAVAGVAYADHDDDHESSSARSHEHEHHHDSGDSHDGERHHEHDHNRDSSHDHDDGNLTPGVAHPVTLSNQGSAPLEVEIRFLGQNPRDFAQTNNCGERLKGQGSCVINVTFLPRAPGARSATMEIHTSGGTKYVYLSGTGI